MADSMVGHVGITGGGYFLFSRQGWAPRPLFSPSLPIIFIPVFPPLVLHTLGCLSSSRVVRIPQSRPFLPVLPL